MEDTSSLAAFRNLRRCSLLSEGGHAESMPVCDGLFACLSVLETPSLTRAKADLFPLPPNARHGVSAQPVFSE